MESVQGGGPAATRSYVSPNPPWLDDTPVAVLGLEARWLRRDLPFGLSVFALGRKL